MRATVITPPGPIVSLEEAKRHLIVEHDDHDLYITSLIDVATAWLDGPAGWLRRALGEQVLELETEASAWHRNKDLPYPPLISVESETPTDDGCRVRIRYRAGYPFKGEGDVRQSTVPAPIRHAILLMVGDLYANRENGGTTTSAAEVSMLLTAERMLQSYRMRLLG